MTQNLKIEVLTGDISIDGMVVTNLVTKEELSTAIVKKADLGTDGKIPTSQLPAEIVNTAGIVDEVKLQLETSIKDAVDESNAYAESYTDNALSSKADLTSGKVPLEQLPAIDQYPQFSAALSNLSTSILTTVKQRTDELEKSKADLGEDGKVLREQIPSYEKISGLPEQLELMTTQTAAVSGELDHHKLQTADQVDALKENIEANVQQLTDRQSHLMRTYATKELGVDAKVGVKPGEYFYVRSTNEGEMLIEYQNVGGAATPSGKSYPSASYVDKVAEFTALPFSDSKSYKLNERVQLENGDIVKSTIPNNTVNPNVDMTDWLVASSSKKLTIYAEDYGVVNSSTVDSFDKLSYVLNRFIDAEIILPPKFSLSQSVIYSNQTISGVSTSHCVCYMLNGFVGESAFIARDKMNVGASRPQEAIIKNITFVDSSASNDGRGTTSTKNGVDITGTFGVKCLNLKGVRVNRVVFADVGPAGQEQWTKRPEIRGLEGSNVNYLWQFMPTTESRFPYGDVVCSDIYPKGSIKYGAWAEDCDGFTFSGDTLFSSGQLKVSGNYITINTAHAFDGKAALTEPSEISAECIIVASRKNGIRNWNVQITDVFATFAGRLADTTIGNPPQTNKGAWAIRLNNCDEFRLGGVINDPSQGGVFLNNCVNGTVNVTTRRVNTQDTGSGVLPAGTYDAVFLQSCSSVNVNLTDNSPSKRHAVYIDDNSEGNVIRVTSLVRGLGGIGSQVRIPNNNKNFVEVLTKDLSNKLVVFASQATSIIPVVESSGVQSPSIGYGREGINIQFNNSVSTNVLDIPSITSGQKAFIYIQDNGATKFVDQSLATGGKFRFKDGATKLGRDFGCWVWREPNSGFLREI